MLKKVRKNIVEHRMIQPGERVVVAVSGGPDSVALLKALTLLSPEFGAHLIAAHVNHGLRGEDAQGDEAFVVDLCRELGVLCECERIDVASLSRKRKRSVEDMGREVRVHFLMDVAQKHQAQKIALGHTFHDQVETVLMHFLRGAGPGGLKGMLPVREGVWIRPLFNVTREEILTFLEASGLTYRIDRSNQDVVYLRNRIRHELLPELKKRYNPNLEHTLFAMSELVRVEDEFMNAQVERTRRELQIVLGDGEVRINIPRFRQYHEALQRRLIHSLLGEVAGKNHEIGYTHVTSVLHLACGSNPGGFLKLPGALLVQREYDTLILKKLTHSYVTPTEPSDEMYCLVQVPCSVEIPVVGRKMRFELCEKPGMFEAGNENILYMDYEKVVPPLVVRSMKPGDRIQPLGMVGSQKIKSFFINSKIPRHKRRHIPLLADAESVLWIAGMRMSERVKITDKTSKVLKVEFI